MNEAATIAQSAGQRLDVPMRPHVWLGADSLLFSGLLPSLDWHQHSFACALLCPSRPFTMEAETSCVDGRALFAPAGMSHRLFFHGAPVLTLYLAPHEPGFVQTRDVASLRPRVARWDARWDEAVARWLEARDAAPLRACVRDAFGREVRAVMDPRVRRTLLGMARGETLRHTPAELAAAHTRPRISASRLMHLIKEETGSTIRQLQRGYRFWRAAQAMTDGATFTDAAHHAEFADLAHFSRAFRRAYGIAPTRILLANTAWTRAVI